MLAILAFNLIMFALIEVIVTPRESEPVRGLDALGNPPLLLERGLLVLVSSPPVLQPPLHEGPTLPRYRVRRA